MINAVNEFLDDLRGGRMTEAPVVRVKQGQLQGRLVNTPSGKAFYSFQGIPYAKPPLGSLRFKAPQPIDPWDDIRDASSEGNVSAQIDPIFAKQYTGDENCLFLNVYTPSIDGAFLPVMVYIHGGAFKYGSGNTEMYGPDFLVEKDVVVVTINYRLGALGFLSLDTPEVPGNAGIKDVVLALKWVKDNIENFGGNAGNLTVFGESCGGAATSLITASPLSKDLISRAIVQSGTALFEWSFQKKPVENAKNLARSLGCEADGIDEVLDFLNATSAKEIVEAQEKLSSSDGENPNAFSLVIEKEFLGVNAVITEPFIHLLTSGRIAHVPIMIGSTELEFAFDRKTDDLQYFIPQELNIERNSPEALAIAEEIKKLYFKGSHTGVESLHEYYQLLSDKLINIDVHRYVQYLVQSTNVPVYYYKFDYVGELNIASKTLHSLGLKHAMHWDELGYLFRNDFQKEQEPTPQDIKMRERMVRLWTNFAKTGNPTPDENHYLTVTWLPVTKDNLYYLNLGSELSLATNPDKQKMEFWDDLYSKHFKIWDHHSITQTDTNVVVTREVSETNSETGLSDVNTITLIDAPDNIIFVTKEVSEVTDNETGVTDVIETITLVEAPKDINQEVEITVEETPEIEEVTINNDAPVIMIIESTREIEDKIDDTNIINNTPEIAAPAAQINNTPEIAAQDAQEVIGNSPEFVDTDVQKLVSNFSKDIDIPHINGNGIDKPKARTSNEIKMASTNGAPKDVIRANDPPEDDLPKNIGVNKFVNFFESLGGKI